MVTKENSYKVKCIIESCGSKAKEFWVSLKSTCNLRRHLKVNVQVNIVSEFHEDSL